MSRRYPEYLGRAGAPPLEKGTCLPPYKHAPPHIVPNLIAVILVKRFERTCEDPS